MPRTAQRAAPDAKSTASTEQKDRLIARISDLLTSADRDELEYPDDYPLVLATRGYSELQHIAERLESGDAEDRDAAVQELAQMGNQSRQDTIDGIMGALQKLAEEPNLAKVADRILQMEPRIALTELSTSCLHDLLTEVKSGDAESVLARMLQFLPGEEETVTGGESYARMGDKAEKELIDRLLDLGCLERVREQMTDYAGAPDQEHRTRLAREIVVGLWESHGCGEAGKKLVDTSEAFERILNVFIPRGHFVHQFETFMLGCLMFKTVLNLLSREQRPPALQIEDEDVFRMWLMASSLHDVGYPIQLGSRIGKSICELYDALAMKDCAELLRSMSMKSCADRLQNLPLDSSGAVRKTLNVSTHIADLIIERLNVGPKATRSKVQKKWDCQDHGVIGAAIIWQKMIESGCVDGDHPLEYYTPLTLATAAMSLHSFRADDFAFSVEYRLMPLTFTLIAMDELQEWNRSTGSGKGDSTSFELERLVLDDSHGDRHVLELTFQCQNDRAEERERLLREIAFKRHKLSNLVPCIVSPESTEFEIHAHFLGVSDEPESILIPVLHRGDPSGGSTPHD